MWNRIKNWFKKNWVPFLIFTLIVVGMIVGVIMFPKWALILIMVLGWAGWTAYKIGVDKPI